MYAIIEDGGRQYRVEEGQEIQVDYREVAKGEEITFDRVLAISGDDGLRLDDKIYVQKLRRRKNSRRRTGHRQMHTAVRIEKIGV